MKLKLIIISTLLISIGAFIGWLFGFPLKAPERKDFVIKARQYSYEPPKLDVNLGDTLYIKLVSLDVIHGFYLEGYDIDAEIKPNVKQFKVRKPSEGFNWKDTSEISIVVNKTGKSRYRCSHTCGNMHPFMQGEIIVHPNRLLHISIGVLLGFVVSILFIFFELIKKNKKQNE